MTDGVSTALQAIKTEADELKQEEHRLVRRQTEIRTRLVKLERALGALADLADLPQIMTMPEDEPPTLEWLLSGAGDSTPSMTDAILQSVQRRPGISRKELVDQLVAAKLTTSDDPRKVISTRIGQMLRDQRLLEDHSGMIYPSPVTAQVAG